MHINYIYRCHFGTRQKMKETDDAVLTAYVLYYFCMCLQDDYVLHSHGIFTNNEKEVVYNRLYNLLDFAFDLEYDGKNPQWLSSFTLIRYLEECEEEVAEGRFVRGNQMIERILKSCISITYATKQMIHMFQLDAFELLAKTQVSLCISREIVYHNTTTFSRKRSNSITLTPSTVSSITSFKSY